ncbi:hypothetical protein [Embleya sp. NPDC059259]|uniref:hypothetical protein n=1 Tax=unclassified Embleya TaxID=2699296 RepID=UPI003693E4DB
MSRRRSSGLLTLPTLVLSLLLSLLLTPAVGPFAASASATEHEFLNDYGLLPQSPQPKCADRRLHLDAGTYAWTLDTPGGSIGRDAVELESGWYRWTVCVWRRVGTFNQTVELRPENPGALLTMEYPFAVDSALAYTWGSMLYCWKPA